MQVFKVALRIFIKHPAYIAIYVFWIAFMGVFIGMNSASTPDAEFSATRPDIAIIDRDKSDLSFGLSDFLAQHSSVVDIDDNTVALQDAIAQNRVQYIIIIPEGFDSNFSDASKNSTSFPALETVSSYESVAAHMMDSLVDEYLSTAQIYFASTAAASSEEALSYVQDNMAQSTEATLVYLGKSAAVSQQWTIYMSFSGYTIMLSIIMSVSVVMSAFNRVDIKRRNVSSPLSALSMNLQIGAASCVITLLCWAWVSALGLFIFGHSLAGVDPVIILMSSLSLLVFCTVPLSIGFLLGLLSIGEMAINSIGNIVALVFSFLGGIWISLDIMSDLVVRIAHFIPTFYYGDAISKTVDLRSFSPDSMTPIFADMGIMLLFSAVIFAVALVAARLRAQSSEAGGNAAAAYGRS